MQMRMHSTEAFTEGTPGPTTSSGIAPGPADLAALTAERSENGLQVVDLGALPQRLP